LLGLSNFLLKFLEDFFGVLDVFLELFGGGSKGSKCGFVFNKLFGVNINGVLLSFNLTLDFFLFFLQFGFFSSFNCWS